MQFLVIGDLHGQVGELARIDQYCAHNGIETVIQVGDLGVCWPGEDCPIIRYFNKRDRQKRPGAFWITCLGNHDNWKKFNKNLFKKAIELNDTFDKVTLVPYAPGLAAANRPSFLDIFGGMVFCGGAVSTDADYTPSIGWSGNGHPGRIEGKDWWKTEAPSQAQLQAFCDLIEEKNPKYIFTHDGPEFAHRARGGGICQKSNLRYDYCSRSFEVISKVTKHNYARWFFGHHHELVETERNGRIYHCSGLHGEGWLIDDTANTAAKINFSLSKGKNK